MSKRLKSNSIRIIAGKWRGRRVPVPNSPGLRPTTDRVRETAFNWLMHDIAGTRCLDLFAGSGALGLESLSRGAAYVQFVESCSAVAKSLRETLETLQSDFSPGTAELLEVDAMAWLQQPPGDKFDIVYLDPPFQTDQLAAVVQLLEQHHWLSHQALIYIECSASKSAVRIPPNWGLHRHGSAGQSAYYLYRRSNTPAGLPKD